VLITVDKLDKIGAEGVVAELRERQVTPAAVDALAVFLTQVGALGSLPFSAEAIAQALPSEMDRAIIAELAALGESVDPTLLQFDPFLVRGMGYYTGTIFEIVHPDFAFSLGGGGRYDGMIGRFLGVDVPACGFSIGFERIMEVRDVEWTAEAEAVVLVHEANASMAQLLTLKTELIAVGKRVRLERRTKNVTALLNLAAASGFTTFAFVTETTQSVSDLEFKDL
jgi:histidyl-tRNA synthetase